MFQRRRPTRAQTPHERIHARSEDASFESSVDTSSDQDEYQDEDIDFRAEKIADKASLNIPWGRQWTYTLRVLASRLQLPDQFSHCCGLNSQSRFPTPLARTRLVEVSSCSLIVTSG
jgi:hypothetical protein